MCHEAGQSAFLHTQLIYLRISIISYLATFLDTNSLSVLMCRAAVNPHCSLLRLCSSITRKRLLNNSYNNECATLPCPGLSGENNKLVIRLRCTAKYYVFYVCASSTKMKYLDNAVENRVDYPADQWNL